MQITKGYTFGSTESVTANKLHTLVDSAVIASPLTIANIDAIIGGTTPAAGTFTTVGLGTPATTKRLTVVDEATYSQGLAFSYLAAPTTPHSFIGCSSSSETLWITTGGENRASSYVADGWIARNNDGAAAGKAVGLLLKRGELEVYSSTGLTNGETYTWRTDTKIGKVFGIDGNGANGVIGGTTPAAGSFTAITGTGTATFNDAANATVALIDNDGTGTGLHIQQDGISATNKNALRIYSNSIQVNSPLAFIEMDNASSDQAALKIKQNGTGYGIEISNNNTGAAININQAGILATTKHAILAYSNAAQTSEDAALVKVWQDSPSSSEPALEVVNDGTGAAIEITAGNIVMGSTTLTEANLISLLALL